MANFWDNLLGVGNRALENLVDRATLGKDNATKLRLAEEAEFYARLNGSGPYDLEGYKRDSQRDPYFGNPFEGTSTAAMTGPSWLGFGVLAVLAVALVLVLRR